MDFILGLSRRFLCNCFLGPFRCAAKVKRSYCKEQSHSRWGRADWLFPFDSTAVEGSSDEETFFPSFLCKSISARRRDIVLGTGTNYILSLSIFKSIYVFRYPRLFFANNLCRCPIKNYILVYLSYFFVAFSAISNFQLIFIFFCIDYILFSVLTHLFRTVHSFRDLFAYWSANGIWFL